MRKNELFKNAIKHQQVLSLQIGNITRNYYFIIDSMKRCFYLMDERQDNFDPEYYSVFSTWEDIVREWKKFEFSMGTEKRWWSFCPGWMAFKPVYIHPDVKDYFGNIIYSAMEGLNPGDLSGDERDRMLAWGNVCEMLQNKSMHLLQ